MRVMIVDDSRVCRAALRALLEADPEIEVVAEAEDAHRAIALLERLSPSLLLLDLQMPGMSGHELLDWVVKNRPVPVVLITGQPGQAGPASTFAALSRGALDLIPKSSEWFPGTPESQRLIARLKTLTREVRGQSAAPSRMPSPGAPGRGRSRVGWVPKIVGLGASTGGPAALSEILGRLPATFPAPIVVAQHMDGEFLDSFVQWLSRTSTLPVRFARDGERLVPGEVRLAPPEMNLAVLPGGYVQLRPPSGGLLHTPSIDALFQSLANAHGADVAAVLLTGMGRDGVQGLKVLHAAGAATAAQDRETSVVYGMPRAAAEAGAAEVILPLRSIPDWLTRFEPNPDPTPRNPKMQKILIVDDSPIVLEARRMLLEDAGYEVVTLDNPLTVAGTMRRELPNLVLLDLNMPAVSGDVVARIVNQYGQASQSIVVLHSDRPEKELRTRAEACGAAGFLRKTDNEEEFLAAVRKFLAAR